MGRQTGFKNQHNLEWRPTSPDPQQVGPPEIATSITDDEAEALRQAGGDSDQVVEIGTGYGFSAITMALAGAQRVVTCDPHNQLSPRSYPLARDYVEAWGVLDQVRLLIGTAAEVASLLELLAWSGGLYDLAFVDGDHSYQSVLADAKQVEPLVKPGGWLAFHDYGEVTCPGVAEALDELWPAPDRVVDSLYLRRR